MQDIPLAYSKHRREGMKISGQNWIINCISSYSESLWSSG